MKDTKKAKWLVGSSAVLLSGLILTQLSDGDTAESKDVSQKQLTSIDQSKISKKEKELLQLDWTNFDITEATIEKHDRQTRRS